jgi:hypothetical protein
VLKHDYANGASGHSSARPSDSVLHGSLTLHGSLYGQVVKMDIEGAEHAILNSMLADGSIRLIDELMVEVHYHHPGMPGWDKLFPQHTLYDANALLIKLREAGVVTHPWP